MKTALTILLLCAALAQAGTFLQAPVTHGEVAAGGVAVPAFHYGLLMNHSPSNTMPDSGSGGYTATNQSWNSGFSRNFDINTADNRTVSVWWNYETAKSTFPFGFGTRVFASTRSWGFFVNAGNSQLRFRNGASVTDTAGGAINDGNWHNLIGVINGAANRQIFYVDGVNQGTNTHANVNYDTGQGVRLGSGGASGSFEGQGMYLRDELVFDGEISPAEVSNYYNSGGVTMPDETRLLFWNWTNEITGARPSGTASIPAYGDLAFGSASQPSFDTDFYDFDGSDYIEAWWNWDTEYDDKMSISAWINLDVDPTGVPIFYISDFANGAAIGDLLAIGGNNDSGGGSGLRPQGISFRRGGAWSGTTGGVFRVAQTGSWQNVVITFDRTNSHTTHIYYNGVDIGLDLTNATGTTATHNKLIIGGRADRASDWFGGLDDYRIWNDVLTPAEITQLHSDGRDG